MLFLAYGIAWISAAMAASVGIYFTQNPWCLLVMILPLLVNLNYKESK